MEQMPNCPKCNGEYVYHDTIQFVCPDCGNEWSGEEAAADSGDEFIVKDSNGNILQDGDSVILIKDLKVKGSGSLVLKKGSKAKNIRLVNSDHNVDCKIDGVSLALKSEFLKKA
ncbi:zinc ribbon domain-containing protein YjdM [Testudinibacter sp. P27/CKL/0425]